MVPIEGVLYIGDNHIILRIGDGYYIPKQSSPFYEIFGGSKIAGCFRIGIQQYRILPFRVQ